MRSQHSVQKRVKKLLAVCSDECNGRQWLKCSRAPTSKSVAVATGGEALALVKQQYLDGIVLTLDVGEIGLLPLVEEIQNRTQAACASHPFDDHGSDTQEE